jgi:hypothetical protein
VERDSGGERAYVRKSHFNVGCQLNGACCTGAREHARPCSTGYFTVSFPLLDQLMWACLLWRKSRVVLSRRIGSTVDRC